MDIFCFRYADRVSVGDEILVQENNELIPDKVIKKSTFVMEGKNLFKIVYKLLFNNIIHSSTFYSLKHERCHFNPGAYLPVTMEGNIVVDRVLASSYSSVDHDLAHIALLPVRQFSAMTEWIFGEENESSVFFNIVKGISKEMLPYGYILRTKN